MEPICVVLDFAPSTYWAAKKRESEPSARAVRDEWLKGEILRIWKKPGRGLYGARKVWRQLHREGIVVARCTVERLMRELGIAGVTAGRKRPRTTVPGQDRPSDLLERDFAVDAPNIAWVADITHVATAAGWVYAAFVQDLYSRRIVGWQVADHLSADLALDALEMAIWSSGGGVDGLIHHSDRGVQGGFNRCSQHFIVGGVGAWAWARSSRPPGCIAVRSPHRDGRASPGVMIASGSGGRSLVE
ncbi:IS3 family transposase [Spongiactinospora sp. TRM90649]|uniref:IS3 family transposase n=1 Tax=Spongiactinospora sp. TRM90649 TaxID=3031114 RepID=UPI0023F8BE47|nr:IS3 family transposase [Spongiactinospora sp. TRM90649]MDF5758416.1 IS3 family transposase [Spongiactinospora sp. TRM90649]